MGKENKIQNQQIENLELDQNAKLNEALLKRAMGYWVVDEVEEFVYDYTKNENGEVVGFIEGNKRIVKSKTTKHFVPPDLSAIKMLLEQQKDDGADMTEEQLVAERDRLIGMLISMKKEE
ncbi:MAG: hypothetical protein FWE13_02330 [Firmicutes bacterium]|nr:hypothetical protein [Bacillota bacterium]